MKIGRLLLIAALALVLTRPVLAHSELVSAEPAAGATVAGPVSELRLTFSGNLGEGSDVDLFVGGFQAIPDVTSTVSDNELRVHVADPLGPGTYTVQWVAIGVDGHPTGGSYQFGVSARAALPGWVGALLLGTPIVFAVGGFLWWRNRRRLAEA